MSSMASLCETDNEQGCDNFCLFMWNQDSYTCKVASFCDANKKKKEGCDNKDSCLVVWNQTSYSNKVAITLWNR